MLDAIKQLFDKFNKDTGHTHSGAPGDGGPIVGGNQDLQSVVDNGNTITENIEYVGDATTTLSASGNTIEISNDDGTTKFVKLNESDSSSITISDITEDIETEYRQIPKWSKLTTDALEITRTYSGDVRLDISSLKFRDDFESYPFAIDTLNNSVYGSNAMKEAWQKWLDINRIAAVGTCSTAANTAAKEATFPNFPEYTYEPLQNTICCVIFQNSNTAANPTLRGFSAVAGVNFPIVNSNGTPLTSPSDLAAGANLFTFVGYEWRLLTPGGIGGGGFEPTTPQLNAMNSGVTSSWISNTDDFISYLRRDSKATTRIGKSVSASTADPKVITLSDFGEGFVPQVGTLLVVTFQHEDTAGAYALKIGSEASVDVKKYTADFLSSEFLEPGDITAGLPHLFEYHIAERWMLLTPGGMGGGGGDQDLQSVVDNGNTITDGQSLAGLDTDTLYFNSSSGHDPSHFVRGEYSSLGFAYRKDEGTVFQLITNNPNGFPSVSGSSDMKRSWQAWLDINSSISYRIMEVTISPYDTDLTEVRLWLDHTIDLSHTLMFTVTDTVTGVEWISADVGIIDVGNDLSACVLRVFDTSVIDLENYSIVITLYNDGIVQEQKWMQKGSVGGGIDPSIEARIAALEAQAEPFVNWTGYWNTGTLTLPGLSQCKRIEIDGVSGYFGTLSTVSVGCLDGTTIGSTAYIYNREFPRSGDILTFVAAKGVMISTSSVTRASDLSTAVTKIRAWK